MTGRIHSLESFGTVDGPGIRFVVFFQGCPMRCKYCHNPDTWDADAGKEYEAADIIERMVKNKSFYSSGGITATGGEAMMQLDFLIELFTLAKEKNIHTCLDTSGIMFNPNSSDFMSKCDRLISVCDLIMLDIKHIDAISHKELTGCDNTNILAFLDYLEKNNKKVWIRHVLVPGITMNDELLSRLGKYLKNFSCIEKIDVLPYHTLGVFKYEQLGIKYLLDGIDAVSKEDAERAYSVITDNMK